MDASTPSTPTQTSTAVRAYAARCRDVLPEGFGVRSYAGLWLLLATLAPVTSGRERTELEEALGVPAEEAASLAAGLLAEQRDDLDAAVAGWLRPDVTLTGSLPVHLDALPDQAGLDAWASTSTRGRVAAFPVALTPETVLLLASALVAETRWIEPLGVEDDRLLVDERGLLAVVDTEAAGLVAVAVPPGRGDLDVVSVIAEAELPTAWVWSAVDEVTGWLLDGTLLERRVPASGLGAGHAWDVRRVTVPRPAGTTTTEEWTATVPAWTQQSSTTLTRAPGVEAVTGSVLTMIDLEPKWATCVQEAMATYTATGFEAAAVTAIASMAGSAPLPTEMRKMHHVSLRFDRPHAVVTVARGGAWEGVPLVHAWVDGGSDPDVAQSDEVALG